MCSDLELGGYGFSARVQAERIVEHALTQLERSTDEELELPAEDPLPEVGVGQGEAATIFDADWQEAAAATVVATETAGPFVECAQCYAGSAKPKGHTGRHATVAAAEEEPVVTTEAHEPEVRASSSSLAGASTQTSLGLRGGKQSGCSSIYALTVSNVCRCCSVPWSTVTSDGVHLCRSRDTSQSSKRGALGSSPKLPCRL